MSADPITSEPRAERKIVLVGNPNVGKSVIFGALTGRYVTVSNYPGTTVEMTSGKARIGAQDCEIIDTPGTNTLIPQSEDERVTRDVLLQWPDAHIIQVGDVKNLRRVLLLTLQLAEYGVPFTICLNMIDEARERDITVDTAQLSSTFGVPVVETAATRRWGLDKLRKEALQARPSAFRLTYSPVVEEGIAQLLPMLGSLPAEPRAIALSILAGDETVLPYLEEHVAPEVIHQFDAIRAEFQGRSVQPLAYVINRDRLTAADAILADVYKAPSRRIGNFRQWLGAITMHKIWGLPFLAAILVFAWWFVGKIGAGIMVDFLENTIFNGYMNPWIIRGFDAIFRFPHTHLLEEGVLSATYTVGAGHLGILQTAGKVVHDLFVGPYGIVTMALTYAIAIVLPVVGTFFIFFGILEDSGYLPRLAVMLNRLFKTMGLNGKAVLPMVLGLGCDTMATLTTRILETKKERVIVTLLLALGVPCSAQLGVIMAMLGALNFKATLIWLAVVGGTIMLVGWLAGKLVRGESADFLLELPPLRMPKISNILIKVMARAEWYLKEAVPLFIVGTFVLYFTDVTGLLVRFQKAIAPLVVGILHLPVEAANAFLIGFLRRDYGAAGLFMMQRDGNLDPIQTVVSLSVITLFIPCIANFFMMIKERGMKTALYMTAFIIPYAFGIGWILQLVLHKLQVNLAG